MKKQLIRATYLLRIFLRYFEEYKKQGVAFWGLSQGNEILLGYEFNTPMPNLILLPPQLKTWTQNYLGPLMKSSEFSDLKIITVDDDRPFLQWYSREVSCSIVSIQTKR